MDDEIKSGNLGKIIALGDSDSSWDVDHSRDDAMSRVALILPLPT